MKRKLICLFIFALVMKNAFTTERYLNFRISENTSGVYLDNGLKKIEYKKNDIIKARPSLDYFSSYSYPELNGDNAYKLYAFDCNNKKEPAIKAEYLMPEITKDLLPDDILTYKKNNSKRLVFSNFVDFLSLGDIKNFDTMEDTHYRVLPDEVEYSAFAEEIKSPYFNVVLTNIGINMRTGDSIAFSCIEKIAVNKYKCVGIANRGYVIEDFDMDANPFGWLGIMETTPDDTFEAFLLIIDGDYILLDNETTGKHIVTFVTVDDSVIEELCNLLATSKCDLSRVTWPRHADGSCDYDNSSTAKKASFSSTNVAPNKQMSVTENLKLRSGEATSTTVLTVMQAGTKVKILELGKLETIDGINSNWVKVEVISGKDRDGKEIKKKTTGWCYGGYLK